MEYQDFLNEFIYANDKEIKFYDKKMDKVISVDAALYFLAAISDDFDMDQLLDEDKGEFIKIKKLLENDKRYLVMPPVDNVTLELAKKAYLFEVPQNEKKSIHSTEDVIRHSFKNGKKFDKYWDFFIEDYMNYWLNNHDLDLIEEDKKYNLCFKWMKLIYKLKPWDYFNDQQLVKIKMDRAEFYINILGNSGECYGLTIYYGKKGLYDFNLLINEAENNPDGVLFLSLQDAVSFYYDHYGSLDEEFCNIIRKSGIDFEEGSYPNILSFREGKFPISNLDKSELDLAATVLKTLYIGMLSYIQSNYSGKLKVDQLLEIDLTDFYTCKLKTWKNNRRDLVNDYGLSFALPNSECRFYEDLLYEVKLDALHRPSEVDNEKKWNYIFLVRDVNSDKIIFHDLVVYQDDQKALPQIVDNLKQFAMKNGFSKNVIIHSFLEFEIVVEALGDQVKIIKGDLSEELEGFLELINNEEGFDTKGVIN